MPATLVAAHIAPADLVTPVTPLVQPRPAPVRLVRGGRACPVCAERRCSDPAACAAEFAARSWGECDDCDGSGFDTLGLDIWCPTCGGARVLEV